MLQPRAEVLSKVDLPVNWFQFYGASSVVENRRCRSVDPLTASATIRNPQTFNRYTYALNSPYKFTDPLGLISQSTGACGQWCPNSDDGGGLVGGSDSGHYESAAEYFERVQQTAKVSEVVVTGALTRNLMERAQERFAKTLGSIVGDAGTGREVPGTKVKPVNCVAYSLGLTRWVQTRNPKKESPIEVLEITGVRDGYLQSSVIWESSESYSLEDIPKAYGAISANDYDRTPFGYRRLRAFMDPENPRNYHIVRQDNLGFWSSKNDIGSVYVGIRAPNTFYAKYYKPVGLFKTLDYFLLDPPRNPGRMRF